MPTSSTSFILKADLSQDVLQLESSFLPEVLHFLLVKFFSPQQCMFRGLLPLDNSP